MKHKTMKISMGVSLLVCAMLSLAGVAFAIAYQGSATNPVSPASGETITVSVDDNTGIFASPVVGASVYTLNTVNDGTNFTLNTLMKDHAVAPGSLYTDKKFHYDADAFELNTTDWGVGETHYSAYEVGAITVIVRQTADATDTAVTLTLTGLPSEAIHQYGFSLVCVKDGAVYDYTAINLDMSSDNEQEVTLKAYLVWSETVPVANYDDISAFSIASATVTATAVANTPSP